jgi:NAD(P)-dependent dehydrogenase (short-subunit alcohol dehydrogenase family)
VQHVYGKRMTIDRFKSHFAVNFLANLFVLMVLESMHKERGRIVMISTAMDDSHHWTNRRIFRKGQKEMFTGIELIAHGEEDGETAGEKHMGGMRRYAVSKCLLVMFMYIPSLCTLFYLFTEFFEASTEAPAKQGSESVAHICYISRP